MVPACPVQTPFSSLQFSALLGFLPGRKRQLTSLLRAAYSLTNQALLGTKGSNTRLQTQACLGLCWDRWVKVSSTSPRALNPQCWENQKHAAPTHAPGWVPARLRSKEAMRVWGQGHDFSGQTHSPAPTRNMFSLSQQLAHAPPLSPTWRGSSGGQREKTPCAPPARANTAGPCSSPPPRHSECQGYDLFTCYKCHHLRHPSPSNCLGTR